MQIPDQWRSTAASAAALAGAATICLAALVGVLVAGGVISVGPGAAVVAVAVAVLCVTWRPEDPHEYPDFVAGLRLVAWISAWAGSVGVLTALVRMLLT